MMGGLFEGYNDWEIRGCMVWGDPWRQDEWESSQGFVTKWGWLLKGCDDVVRSSNKWRASRGEEPLVIEVE